MSDRPACFGWFRPAEEGSLVLLWRPRPTSPRPLRHQSRLFQTSLFVTSSHDARASTYLHLRTSVSDAIVHKEIATTIPHTQQHSDPVLPAFHLHNPPCSSPQPRS